MQLKPRLIGLLPLILIIVPNIAQAHIIGGTGLASGIAHPFLGADHLLAMIAVGIISTQLKEKAVWKLPAEFILFMIIGGLVAINGFALSINEIGVALSVLCFGLLIALSKKIPVNWGIVCVAIFALFHGHAHGEEIPLIASPTLYSIGFVLSTATLHITGIIIALYAHKTTFTKNILRFSGLSMSLIGLFFLLGL